MTKEQFKQQFKEKGYYQDQYLKIEKKKTMLDERWYITFTLSEKPTQDYIKVVYDEGQTFEQLMIIASNFIDDSLYRLKVLIQKTELEGVFKK